jgi:hypothetical protein
MAPLQRGLVCLLCLQRCWHVKASNALACRCPLHLLQYLLLCQYLLVLLLQSCQAVLAHCLLRLLRCCDMAARWPCWQHC